MELTAYTSDLHGNTDYVSALNTVMNYMSEVYDSDNALVVGGDFTGETKDLKNQQQVMMDQYKEGSQMNVAFSEFQGQVYGITGNWDSPLTRQTLSNVKFIEYAPTEIHGKVHYGVTHSSANFFNPAEPHSLNPKDSEYSSLEEHFEEVKKAMPSIDVLVTHEGPHKDFCHAREETGQKPQLHKGLEKLVEETGTSFFCGHVHSSLYENFENGAYGMRSCAENNHGSLFLRVQHEGKEVLYEIGNEQLLAWAKEIDPNGKFQLGSQKKHEQMERQMALQEAYSAHVMENHPEFVELEREYQTRSQEVGTMLKQEVDAGNIEKSNEAINEYIGNNFADVIELEKKYIERRKEMIVEFQNTLPEEMKRAA